MSVTIKLRGDTAANWDSVNPILSAREPGLETDTLRWKVGDGIKAWQSLKYWGATAVAFSATLSSNQTISTATNTKVQFDTEEYDELGDYDSGTNYRFTPTVAGRYLITAGIGFLNLPSGTIGLVYIYLNGAFWKRDSIRSSVSTGGVRWTPKITALIDLNGTTDYLEVYGYQNSGSYQDIQAGPDSFFQAQRVE